MSLHQLQTSNDSSSPPPPSHAKTRSLPRSGSGLSVSEQLGSTASGYAATGSGYSVDNDESSSKKSSQAQKPPTTAGVTTSRAGNANSTRTTTLPEQTGVEGLKHQQLSYPLQRLLGQQLSFDMDSDDLDELLDPHHNGVTFRQHGNAFHHHHHHHHHNPHSNSNGIYHQHTNGSGGTRTVPLDFQQSSRQLRGFHRHHHVPHHSLNLQDHIQLQNHTLNHISFNPARRSGIRTSSGLPGVSAFPHPPPLPPPSHFESITVDVDV